MSKAIQHRIGPSNIPSSSIVSSLANIEGTKNIIMEEKFSEYAILGYPKVRFNYLFLKKNTKCCQKRVEKSFLNLEATLPG